MLEGRDSAGDEKLRKIRIFVELFEREFVAELRHMEDVARGNVEERKRASLKSLFLVMAGLGSLVPIPGFAIGLLGSLEGFKSIAIWLHRNAKLESVKALFESTSDGRHFLGEFEEWTRHAEHFGESAHRTRGTRAQDSPVAKLDDEEPLSLDLGTMKVFARWIGWKFVQRHEHFILERLSAQVEKGLLGFARVSARRCLASMSNRTSLPSDPKARVEVLLDGIIQDEKLSWLQRSTDWLLVRKERLHGSPVVQASKMYAEDVFKQGAWVAAGTVRESESTAWLVWGEPLYGYHSAHPDESILSLKEYAGETRPLDSWKKRKRFHHVKKEKVIAYLGDAHVCLAKAEGITCALSFRGYLYTMYPLEYPEQVLPVVCADLSDLDLSCADLSNCDFSGSKMSGNLSHAKFNECLLFGVEFSEMTSVGTISFANAQMGFSSMTHADVSHACLDQADLTRANLSDSTFGSLTHLGAIWYEAKIKQFDSTALLHAMAEYYEFVMKRQSEADDDRAQLSSELEALKEQYFRMNRDLMMLNAQAVSKAGAGAGSGAGSGGSDVGSEGLSSAQEAVLEMLSRQADSLHFQSFLRDKLAQLEMYAELNRDDIAFVQDELSVLRTELSTLEARLVEEQRHLSLRVTRLEKRQDRTDARLDQYADIIEALTRSVLSGRQPSEVLEVGPQGSGTKLLVRVAEQLSGLVNPLVMGMQLLTLDEPVSAEHGRPEEKDEEGERKDDEFDGVEHGGDGSKDISEQNALINYYTAAEDDEILQDWVQGFNALEGDLTVNTVHACRTPLSVAIDRNDLSAVRRLIADGANRAAGRGHRTYILHERAKGRYQEFLEKHKIHHATRKAWLIYIELQNLHYKRQGLEPSNFPVSYLDQEGKIRNLPAGIEEGAPAVSHYKDLIPLDRLREQMVEIDAKQLLHAALSKHDADLVRLILGSEYRDQQIFLRVLASIREVEMERIVYERCMRILESLNAEEETPSMFGAGAGAGAGEIYGALEVSALSCVRPLVQASLDPAQAPFSEAEIDYLCSLSQLLANHKGYKKDFSSLEWRIRMREQLMQASETIVRELDVVYAEHFEKGKDQAKAGAIKACQLKHRLSRKHAFEILNNLLRIGTIFERPYLNAVERFIDPVILRGVDWKDEVVSAAATKRYLETPITEADFYNADDIAKTVEQISDWLYGPAARVRRRSRVDDWIIHGSQSQALDDRFGQSKECPLIYEWLIGLEVPPTLLQFSEDQTEIFPILDTAVNKWRLNMADLAHHPRVNFLGAHRVVEQLLYADVDPLCMPQVDRLGTWRANPDALGASLKVIVNALNHANSTYVQHAFKLLKLALDAICMHRTEIDMTAYAATGMSRADFKLRLADSHLITYVRGSLQQSLAVHLNETLAQSRNEEKHALIIKIIGAFLGLMRILRKARIDCDYHQLGIKFDAVMSWYGLKNPSDMDKPGTEDVVDDKKNLIKAFVKAVRAARKDVDSASALSDRAKALSTSMHASPRSLEALMGINGILTRNLIPDTSTKWAFFNPRRASDPAGAGLKKENAEHKAQAEKPREEEKPRGRIRRFCNVM